MKRSIGIDFGTTNCCVATVNEQGVCCVIPSAAGESTTPSMVSFPSQLSPNHKPLVGRDAANEARQNSDETFFAVKRLIGRRFDDPDVRQWAETLPYSVVAAPNGDAWLQVRGVQRSPQQLCSLLLEELRTSGEIYFGDSIEQVIVTVPAHFDNAQRQAMSDAAAIAGIDVRRLINEPTAAALGVGAHLRGDRRIAVCDLGGGTFDVSIVNIEQGVIEVLSSQGELFLGGNDIDQAMLDRLLGELLKLGVDVGNDSEALQRLKTEVIRVKHQLSESRFGTVHLPDIGTLPSGKSFSFQRKVARPEFNDWIEPFLSRLQVPCREAISRCGVPWSKIEDILLVGGTTRMPSVQSRMATIFGKPPVLVENPDEIVAIGAATQCAILDGLIESVVLLDVTSRMLGMVYAGRYQRVIPRNATIPTRQHRIVSTNTDGQRELYFDIYEGESDEIRQLGQFVCRDLPAAPAGDVVLLVEFTVDVDGILRVSASEMGTGDKRQVHMLATAGLTRQEVKSLCDLSSVP